MRLGAKIAIALTVTLIGTYYWYLVDARTAGVAERPINIAALRQQAQAIPGPKPDAIEYVAVAMRRVPGSLVIAGGGLAPEVVADLAYRLRTPGGDTVIDSGMTSQQARDGGYRLYLVPAQAMVETWMRSARHIIFTHEHPGHTGGFARSEAFDQIAGKAVIDANDRRAIIAMQPGAQTRLPAPSDLRLTAIAPGVVVFSTPGHTPGAKMIFVQLQNGREYLFAGDTASMARNVEWLRPRSRLLAQWRREGEDRAAVIGWLKGLADLHLREPRVTIVYGHDLSRLADPRRGPGFTAATGTHVIDANRAKSQDDRDQ